jgi:hypothetical protein
MPNRHDLAAGRAGFDNQAAGKASFSNREGVIKPRRKW